MGKSSGSFIALKPDGSEAWAPLALGAVVGSPSVGKVNGGKERVYFGATNTSVSGLYVYDGFDGSELRKCLRSPGAFDGSLALTDTTYSSITDETAFGVENNAGELLSIRVSSVACPAKSPVTAIAFPGGLVAESTNAYFGDNAAALQSFVLGTNGQWADRSGWPVNVTLVPTGLVSLDGHVGGGGSAGASGGLYAVPFAGSAKASWTPAYSSPTWSPSVGPSKRVVVGTNDSKLGSATFLDSTNSFPVIATSGGIAKGAPAFGEGGRLYVATSTGRFEARSATATDLALDWSESGFGTTVEASINLDCSRGSDGAKLAGRPGIAYVASGSGKVFSLVVDSRGIDTTAPWPKYQHDPRNTGNPNTSLTEFGCQ